MSDPVVITIPGTPDRGLSPNASRNWQKRARITRAHREEARLVTREVVGYDPAFTPPITLHAVIAWEKGRKRMDDDNAKALLKATIDGIADAIGVNDRHITLATVTQDRDKGGKGYVKVAIEEGEG